MNSNFLIDRNYINKIIGCKVCSVKMLFGGMLKLGFSKAVADLSEKIFLYNFSSYWE